MSEQHEPLYKLGRIQVPRKGKLFMLHYWHPSSYSSYKLGDKSWIKKERGSVYNKSNICVVICATNIP
jgi:hypothetical protein